MNSGGICDSFINPTSYLDMSYFLLFYTEKVTNIYELIFFLQIDISFICVLHSEGEILHVRCEDQMFMLETDLEKCPKYHKYTRIVTLSTQKSLYGYVNNSANSAFL